MKNPALSTESAFVEMLTCHARCIPDKRIRFSMHLVQSTRMCECAQRASKACKEGGRIGRFYSRSIKRSRQVGSNNGARARSLARVSWYLLWKWHRIYTVSLFSLFCPFRVKEHASAYFDYKVSSPPPPSLLPPLQCFEIQVKNLTLLRREWHVSR